MIDVDYTLNPNEYKGITREEALVEYISYLNEQELIIFENDLQQVESDVDKREELITQMMLDLENKRKRFENMSDGIENTKEVVTKHFIDVPNNVKKDYTSETPDVSELLVEKLSQERFENISDFEKD